MKNNSRIVITAAVGGGLELFDFVIYLFLSPIIAANFFPHEKSSMAFIMTLAGFAVGYLARPLGGIVYGHFGDRLGRKYSLTWAIFLMAIPTLLISCMPTYAMIGIFAPILLILLRFTQGIALGGDVPGAICFIGEHVSLNKRGIMTAWLIFGINMGAVFASILIAVLTSTLSTKSMQTWGWRIPFLIGAILALIGFYIRHRTTETPEFLQLQRNNNIKRWPIKTLLLQHTRAMSLGFAATALAAIVTAVMSLFMSTYMTHYIGIKSNIALWLNSAAICAYSIACLGIGLAIDRFSALRIMQIGAISAFIFAYPIFAFVSSHNMLLVIIGLVISAPILACVMASLPSVLINLFSPEIRYSGTGVAYNFGFSLFGGTSPLLVALLISTTGLTIIPAFFIMAVACLALIPLILIQKYSNLAT